MLGKLVGFFFLQFLLFHLEMKQINQSRLQKNILSPSFLGGSVTERKHLIFLIYDYFFNDSSQFGLFIYFSYTHGTFS